MYDSAYNVVPDPATPKPYALLLEAMETSGKVAIARFVMRTKEHIAALRALDGRLVLSTMVYADEVNDPTELEALQAVADVAISDKERKIAEALIDSLTEEWDPDAFHDEYREKVLDLIEARAGGAKEIVEGEPAEEEDDTVVDIMAALEASIAEAKKARRRHPAAGADAVGRRGRGGRGRGRIVASRQGPAKKRAPRRRRPPRRPGEEDRGQAQGQPSPAPPDQRRARRPPRLVDVVRAPGARARRTRTGSGLERVSRRWRPRPRPGPGGRRCRSGPDGGPSAGCGSTSAGRSGPARWTPRSRP